ncbi:leucine-rich repeat and guanylate kinase domain-containing protein isoform X1 [Phascolarctos cinereus]|uniref:Leucine-rich repeat and guanylate kinase domain-containing protein n=1 Tax=Phascolarctos cinereus TaxID=38626 RepID=A0A6P5LPX9_PHACI|nr:leucine-rich repeat and guanylate kinase domain-containing protein isoform X2 [Phascolarctos cinereus]
MSSPELRYNRSSMTNTFPLGKKLPSGFSSVSFFLQQLFHNDPSLGLGFDEAEEAEEEDNVEAEEESSESEEEMPVVENEFDGVLREEAVAEALCKLGRSGPGTEQVYLNLSLPNSDLIDVSILCGYSHLENLELSHNKINDLSCVSHMPYLIELNASYNELTTFFGFKPPKNLKKVDFSYNKIQEMNDLHAYPGLSKLILDNNEIKDIKGLENCRNLTHLSLANNKITKMEGLCNLPIKILCLSSNQIEEITCLDNLKTLQNLDLSGNKISSLQGIENHDLLEIINLEDNKIAELSEIKHIENLPLLRVLNLLKNPLQEKPDYWLFVLYTLPRLTELDRKKIKVEQKVEALNKYNPPPEVVAAQDHLTHIANSMMQPQRIFDSTLPSLDAPYPMLVLVGPQAGGKRELAHQLCRQFSTFFRHGACHTTRLPYFGEGDRVDYHFVSPEVFDEMRYLGKFILTYQYNKDNYGLSRDTIEGIARDGLASCVHLEIEGVRSLKHSYFEPRYILLVPMNKEKYEGNLRRMGLFSRSEIEFSVSRVDYYVRINQDNPGYFDALINTDDMNLAYQKLCELIRQYLALSDHLDSIIPGTEDTNKEMLNRRSPENEEYFWHLSSNALFSDFLDSTDRNYVISLSAKLSAEEIPAEIISMQKRREAARQALMGKVPPDCTILFQRGPVPTPLSTIAHLDRTSPTRVWSKNRFAGDSNLIPPPCFSEGVSYRESFIMSKAPALTTFAHFPKEASLMTDISSPITSDVSKAFPTVETAKEQLIKPSFESSERKLKVRPTGYQSTIQPGSNTKVILPPIPQCRK